MDKNASYPLVKIQLPGFFDTVKCTCDNSIAAGGYSPAAGVISCSISSIDLPDKLGLLRIYVFQIFNDDFI